MPINDVNATVFQGCQVGLETVYGTPVAANKQLLALGLEPGIAADVSKFRPMGRKYTTVTAMNKESTQVNLSGQPTYTECIWPLAGILEHAVTGAGPYTHTFNTHPGGRDDIKSFTVEYGSDLGARRFAGAVVRSFGISISRNSGISMRGEMIGQAIQEGITLTVGPTAVELIPVLTTDVDVFIDTSAASLGNTQIDLPFSIDWNLNNKFSPVYALNSSLGTSFQKVAETAPEHTLSLVTAYDDQGQDLLANFRAGDVLFVRIAASNGTESLTLDFCGRITQPQRFSDEEGAYAIGYQLDAIEDDDWGNVVEIAVVNSISGL